MRIRAQVLYFAVATASALVVVAVVWLRAPAPVAPAPPRAGWSMPVPVSPPPDAPVPPEAPAEPAALPEADLAAAVDWRADIEGRAFALTNGIRVGNGLPALGRDVVLDAAARAHSEDMSQRGFFAHVDPDGRGPAERIARLSGLPVGAVGENIWMWSGSSDPSSEWLAGQAVAAWAASPAHRDNILRPGYTHLGVGAAHTGRDVRVTQVFRE